MNLTRADCLATIIDIHSRFRSKRGNSVKSEFERNKFRAEACKLVRQIEKEQTELEIPDRNTISNLLTSMNLYTNICFRNSKEPIHHNPHIRPAFRNPKLRVRRNTISMPDGMRCCIVNYSISANKSELATVLIGQEDKVALRLEAKFDVQDRFSFGELRRLNPIAYLNAGFTSFSKNPNFVSKSGEVFNYFISNTNALLTFDRNGNLKIHSLTESPIATTNDSINNLICSSPEQYAEFIRCVTADNLTVLQSQLLIHNGERMIDNHSSKAWQRRRIIGTSDSGQELVFVNFSLPLTLAETALLCSKFGLQAAILINCPHESDVAGFYDSFGKRTHFGEKPVDFTSNLILFVPKS